MDTDMPFGNYKEISLNAVEIRSAAFLLKVVSQCNWNVENHESRIRFSKEINNLSEIKKKPKLIISFTGLKPNLIKEFSPLIESKPLSVLENSLEDKKTLWSKIKEHKNGSSAG